MEGRLAGVGHDAVSPGPPARPPRFREPSEAVAGKMTVMSFRSSRRARAGASAGAGVVEGLGAGAGVGVGTGDALAGLHREHYRSLVRLANLLLDDRGRSEEIVQDAFVKLQLRWGGLRRLDRAPAYLRSAVLNGARSALRHGKVVGRHAERRTVPPNVPTPETGALAAAEHQRMVAALRLLPARQREALALRYYLDLGERDMAEAMDVSPGSVKTHLRRGLATLAQLLGEDPDDGGGGGEVDRPGGTEGTGEVADAPDRSAGEGTEDRR